ncbi:hypothetical protein [Cellulomonas soli]
MTATVVRPAGADPSAPSIRADATQTLTGTRTMIRLVVRRHRVRLAVWWVVLVGMFAYVGAYYRDVLGTQAALDDFAALSDTPSIKALTGLAAAPATLGGAVWTKIWMTTALALAFGVVFLVTRNGRADEELGRTELLRSRPSACTPRRSRPGWSPVRCASPSGSGSPSRPPPAGSTRRAPASPGRSCSAPP